MQTTPANTSAIAPAPVRGSGPPGLVDVVVGTWNVLIPLGPEVVVTTLGVSVVVTRPPAVVTDDGTVEVALGTVVLDDAALELVETEGTVVDAVGDEVLDDGPMVVGDTVVAVGTVVVVAGEGPGNAQRLLKTAMPSSVQFFPA
jgi:hypothetical protein